MRGQPSRLVKHVVLPGSELQGVERRSPREAAAGAHRASIGNEPPPGADRSEDRHSSGVKGQRANHRGQEDQRIQPGRELVGAVDFHFGPYLQYGRGQTATCEGLHEHHRVRRKAPQHHAEDHHRQSRYRGEEEAVALQPRKLERLHLAELYQGGSGALAERLDHRRGGEQLEEPELAHPRVGDLGHRKHPVEHRRTHQGQRGKKHATHSQQNRHANLDTKCAVLQKNEERLPLLADGHDHPGAHRQGGDVADAAPHEAVVEEEVVRRTHHTQNSRRKRPRVTEEGQRQRDHAKQERACHKQVRSGDARGHRPNHEGDRLHQRPNDGEGLRICSVHMRERECGDQRARHVTEADQPVHERRAEHNPAQEAGEHTSLSGKLSLPFHLFNQHRGIRETEGRELRFHELLHLGLRGLLAKELHPNWQGLWLVLQGGVALLLQKIHKRGADRSGRNLLFAEELQQHQLICLQHLSLPCGHGEGGGPRPLGHRRQHLLGTCDRVSDGVSQRLLHVDRGVRVEDLEVEAR
mmetsp:Transcript_92915/g.268309  ORF Transcript_92915/g.268309 Transcript_92915/m.268309 type:complete len:524 (-) Transcript_92915:112-1683(-)